jgi:hypothetical protein
LDLAEIFLQRKRAVITDITQRPFDRLHNFKLRLYVAILQDVTDYQDVYGVDFDTLDAQRVFMPEPTQAPAR